MIIKKLLILFFLPLLTTSVVAETVAYKLKGNLKSNGSEAIEVSATPLIDSKEIIKSKKYWEMQRNMRRYRHICKNIRKIYRKTSENI